MTETTDKTLQPSPQDESGRKDDALQLGMHESELLGTGADDGDAGSSTDDDPSPEGRSGKDKSVKKRRRGCLFSLLISLLLAPVWLPVVMIVMLYIPVVQDAAVRAATSILSQQTGLEISIDRLRLTPLLDVDLQHFVALDECQDRCGRANVAGMDTLMALDHLVLDLDFSDILDQRIGVDAIDLRRGQVDTKNWVDALSVDGRIGDCYLRADGVDLGRGHAHLNEVFLSGSDVRIAMRDTTIIDTTTSRPLEWELTLDDVRLVDTHVAFASRRDTIGVDGRFGRLILSAGKANLATNLYTFDRLDLDSTEVHYTMPYDSLVLDAQVGQLRGGKSRIDVGENVYEVPDLGLYATRLSLVMPGTSLATDIAHMQLSDLIADVAKGRYTLADLGLRTTNVGVLAGDVDLTSDINHLALSDLVADVDKDSYSVKSIDAEQTKVNLAAAGTEIHGSLADLQLQSLLADVARGTYGLDHLKADHTDLRLTAGDTSIQGLLRTIRIGDVMANLGRDSYEVGRLSVEGSKVGMRTSSISAQVEGLRQLTASGIAANASRGRYAIDNLRLDASRMSYDALGASRQTGLDPNHLLLTSIAARMADMEADMDKDTYKGNLTHLSFDERCGFRLQQLSARFLYNTSQLKVDDVALRTPTSNLKGHADIRFNPSTNPQPIRHFDAYLQADLSKQDVMTLARYYIPDAIAEHYPDRMLTVGVDVAGTLDDVRVNYGYLRMPNMLEATIDGQGYNLADMSRTKADVGFTLHTYDLSLVKHLAGLDGVIDLPPMTLTGRASIDGQQYATRFDLAQGTGRAHVDGTFNTATMAYQAAIRTQALALRAFLPEQPLGPLTAKATIEGRGFDPYDASTTLRASLDVERFKYSIYNLAGISGHASLDRGLAKARLHSGSQILDADASATARMKRNLSQANFDIDLRSIDLRALGVVDYPLCASMVSHIEGASNLKDIHWVDGNLSDLTLTYRDTTFTHSELDFKARVETDSTYAYLQTGDLLLSAGARGGYDKVLTQLQRTYGNIEKQLKDYRLDEKEFRKFLPTMTAHIESGRDNVVYRYLNGMGYGFEHLYLDATSSPRDGLNGRGEINAFVKDSMRIDKIALTVGQDTAGIAFDAHAYNAPDNPDFSFDAHLKGSLLTSGADALFTLIDDQDKTWFNVGVQGNISREGKRLSIVPHNPILAYRDFKVNADNYLYMGEDNRVEADVDMLADDGTGLKLYSTESGDSTILQDLTLGLNHFNVGELCRVVPSLPNAAGFLSGDVHMVQTADEMSFMCDLNVDDTKYEGTEMGNIGLNAIYLPNADGSQYVNGILMRNGLNIAEVDGTYYPGSTEGTVDVKAHLLDLPISLADAFTGGLMRFTGTLGGDLGFYGPLSDLSIDGTLTTDSMHIIADEYSVNLRVVDDSIRVSKNQLHLDQLTAYSTGRSPLQMDGDVDFRDFSNIKLQLQLQGKNFELMNAGRTRGASAYGKAYVDLDAMVRGTLDNISVVSRLLVLGKTDLTYVLKDSPLNPSDNLDDLVTFVNFKDSTVVEEEVASKPLNLTMNMLVDIDEAAQVHCLLSEDRTNYVNVQGGGNLTLVYDPRNGMQLFGKYTIQEGDIKYSMLVVPLKNFTIANGSYVEFQGDMANPRLSIAASERLTTTITENGSPRSVAFDVGLSVTQTLEKMGLAFTIVAPEDMSIQNELAAMTDEQRGRVAVTMLATGMYINETSTGGTGSGLSASNALNAFLQSQISALSSKALKSVDLSVGMENGMTSTGSTTMDYSFRFAKRFWNNRISVIIGGKVSTGNQAENTGQTIIDNVSLEYRLDNSATRYVKLFYDKDYASLLEGEVTEMGAGIVLRRKTEKLGELFMFRSRKKNEAQPPQPAQPTSKSAPRDSSSKALPSSADNAAKGRDTITQAMPNSN